MKRIATILILMLGIISVYGQDFYPDGSMKLSGVSTDEKYGYEPNQETSVKVGSIRNQQAYLRALKGPNGEIIHFKRLGSCCGFESETAIFGEGFLDRYEISYDGLAEPVVLYLNGYDYEDPKCPVGFTFRGANEIERPVIFPEEKIIKVEICNEKNIYSVHDDLLNDKVQSLPKPDTNPQYAGGLDKLKKYFEDNPLTDTKALNKIFRVHISFIVNCRGEAGNYQIISVGQGELETLANQVLEVVNNMPQDWRPALKNDKTVDSYQTLSFTVVSGRLGKVSYR